MGYPSACFEANDTAMSGDAPVDYSEDAEDDLSPCQEIWFGTVQVDPLEHILMGYVAPALSIVTLLMNSCAISVLMHKSFQMSSSHMILLAIFAVDMATAGVPLPFCIYFYTFEYHRHYLPFIPCYLRLLIMRLVPTITNTASTWLFTYLALQRYIIVCKRTTAGGSKFRTWITAFAQKKSYAGIVSILVMAIAVHSTQIIDRYPTRTTCAADGTSPKLKQSLHEFSESPANNSEEFIYRNSTVLPNLPISDPSLEYDVFETCWLGSRFHESLPRQVGTAIYATYYIFRAIFIHLVPCGLVTFATGALVAEVRLANKRRKSLLLKPVAGIIESATAAVSSSITQNDNYREKKSFLNKFSQLRNKNTAEKHKKPSIPRIEIEKSSPNKSILRNGSPSPIHKAGDQRRASRQMGVSIPILEAETDLKSENECITIEMPVENSDPMLCDKADNSAQGNDYRRRATSSFTMKALRKSSTISTTGTGGKSSAGKGEKEYAVTSMLVVLISIFLSVQLPQAIMFTVGILSGLGIISFNYDFDLPLQILNMLYLLTFPVQSGFCFVINRAFRQAFKRMIGLSSSSNSCD